MLFFQKRLGIIMASEYFPQKRLNRLVSLPVPRLVVFYNGTEGADDRILRLSDAFARAGNPEDFEIQEFLAGHRAEVKDLCITEYNEAETMQMIREEGIMELLANQVRTGDLSAEKAARYAGMSMEQFLSYRK